MEVGATLASSCYSWTGWGGPVFGFDGDTRCYGGGLAWRAVRRGTAWHGGTQPNMDGVI